MEYEKINTDQQVQMLEQRMAQYEAEHFGHVTNRALLLASPHAEDDDVQAAIQNAEEAMATLDEAHANVKKEIAKLKAAPKSKSKR